MLFSVITLNPAFSMKHKNYQLESACRMKWKHAASYTERPARRSFRWPPPRLCTWLCKRRHLSLSHFWSPVICHPASCSADPPLHTNMETHVHTHANQWQIKYSLRTHQLHVLWPAVSKWHLILHYWLVWLDSHIKPTMGCVRDTSCTATVKVE